MNKYNSTIFELYGNVLQFSLTNVMSFLFITICRQKKSQGPMDNYTQRKQAITPQEQKEITDAILDMIVEDMRPLDIVAGEGFKKMCLKFNPQYVLPSRTTFTTMMEKKYERERLKVSLSHTCTHYSDYTI